MTAPQTGRRAYARTSDPYTSQIAAGVATRSLPSHRALVLAILEEEGVPLTHPQIVAIAGRWRMMGRGPSFTEQSLRSRCAELVRDGLVVEVPDERGVSQHGNPARLFVASSVYEAGTDRTQGVIL